MRTGKITNAVVRPNVLLKIEVRWIGFLTTVIITLVACVVSFHMNLQSGGPCDLDLCLVSFFLVEKASKQNGIIHDYSQNTIKTCRLTVLTTFNIKHKR